MDVILTRPLIHLVLIIVLSMMQIIFISLLDMLLKILMVIGKSLTHYSITVYLVMKLYLKTSIEDVQLF